MKKDIKDHRTGKKRKADKGWELNPRAHPGLNP